jgi:hypothetical protein
MSVDSRKNMSRALEIKRICITTIVTVVLVICALKISSTVKNNSLKNKYQYDMRFELLSIQVRIESAINNDSRGDIRTAALEYERLGTNFANASTQLFGSYLDTGEWGRAAQILLGFNDYYEPLFQSFDEPLSELEIKFLEQLSELNEVVLADISDDSAPQGLRDMSIRMLKETLNSYHTFPLGYFFSSWESS